MRVLGLEFTPARARFRAPVVEMIAFVSIWALEYHTLILFCLKEPLWNKSLYFFLPGYLKAQVYGGKGGKREIEGERMRKTGQAETCRHSALNSTEEVET